MNRTIVNAWVEGEPKAQPRPRAFKTKGGAVRVYDPATAEGWKSRVAAAVRDQIPETPIDYPVKVSITFAFRRPKSHFKKSGDVRSSAPRHHLKKPDLDNLLKAVFDCFTDIGIWRDDSVVVQCDAWKVYGDGDYGGSTTSIIVSEVD